MVEKGDQPENEEGLSCCWRRKKFEGEKADEGGREEAIDINRPFRRYRIAFQSWII